MLAGALAALPLAAACNRTKTLTVSTTPPLDMKLLNGEVAALAGRVQPGALGVGLLNLESGQYFTFNGDRPFPLQSVFKLHLAAAVLAEMDDGRISLDEAFDLTGQQLSPPWSPIAAAWPARAAYSAGELLAAIIDQSDNTAADVLMKRIGGPGAVTAWLRAKGINETSIDRYERELQPEAHGMASFRPAWAGEQAFAAAREAVPPAQRMTAMQAYLRDPRDTATPRSMISFLRRLDARELLSEVSTARLLELLFATPRGATRLKPGFPVGTRFAHKIGTSGLDLGLNLAFNDVGIVVLPDKRSYVVAVFLAGSTLSIAAADALMTDLARLITRAVG
jgi:beta-lactamase class A